jgi:hypothetical protein
MPPSTLTRHIMTRMGYEQNPCKEPLATYFKVFPGFRFTERNFINVQYGAIDQLQTDCELSPLYRAHVVLQWPFKQQNFMTFREEKFLVHCSTNISFFLAVGLPSSHPSRFYSLIDRVRLLRPFRVKSSYTGL